MCLSQITQKLWCEKLQIPQVQYIYVEDISDASISKIRDFFNIHGNVVVKPAHSGSSLGVSQADTKDELMQAVKLASSIDSSLLVEKTLLDFKEYMVCCVEIDGQFLITEPLGVQVVDGGIFSYEKKFSEMAAVIEKTCNLNTTILSTISQYCKRVFHGIGLRHCFRIDFFVCANGNIILNEINTFPGLVPHHSFLPIALQKEGISIGRLLTSNLRQQIQKQCL